MSECEVVRYADTDIEIAADILANEVETGSGRISPSDKPLSQLVRLICTLDEQYPVIPMPSTKHGTRETQDGGLGQDALRAVARRSTNVTAFSCRCGRIRARTSQNERGRRGMHYLLPDEVHTKKTDPKSDGSGHDDLD